MTPELQLLAGIVAGGILGGVLGWYLPEISAFVVHQVGRLTCR